MITKTIHKEYHHGHPVLREAEPIEVARIPITDDTLEGSILLHPRYIPAAMAYELLTLRAYRRGRSIDIFLDQPLEIKGEAYGILNFKGAGADADRPLLICPDHWYVRRRKLFRKDEYRWLPKNLADGFSSAPLEQLPKNLLATNSATDC